MTMVLSLAYNVATPTRRRLEMNDLRGSCHCGNVEFTLSQRAPHAGMYIHDITSSVPRIV
jgi:hypothetical protein